MFAFFGYGSSSPAPSPLPTPTPSSRNSVQLSSPSFLEDDGDAFATPEGPSRSELGDGAIALEVPGGNGHSAPPEGIYERFFKRYYRTVGDALAFDQAPVRSRQQPASLAGRVQRVTNWFTDAVSEEFGFEGGLRQFILEASRWLNYFAEQLQQSLPFVRRWLEPAPPPPPVAIQPALGLDLLYFAPPEVSKSHEEVITELTESARRLLFGQRELTSDDEEVIERINHILRLVVAQAHRQKDIKELLEGSNLLKQCVDRFLPACERAGERVNMQFSRELVVSIVNLLVDAYPFDIICRIEEDDGPNKRGRVLMELADRDQLHPVVMANLRGDQQIHEMLISQHIEQILFRILHDSVAEPGADALALRLSSHRVEDTVFRAGARFGAGRIYKLWDELLGPEKVAAVLDGLLASIQQKGKAEEKSSSWNGENYIPDAVQDKVFDTLIPRLGQDILRFSDSTMAWAKWGRSWYQDRVKNPVNKMLSKYLEVTQVEEGEASPSSAVRVRSSFLVKTLRKVHERISDIHLHRPQEVEADLQEKNWWGGWLTWTLDLEGTSKTTKKWMEDHRPAIDNILLLALDDCFARLFPGMMEQALVDRLEQPLRVCPKDCVDFQKLFSETVAPLIGWDTLGELDVALSKADTWVNLARRVEEARGEKGSFGLEEWQERFEALRDRIAVNLGRESHEDLLKILELALSRRPVAEALKLPTYQAIDHMLTGELLYVLRNGNNPKFEFALMQWRSQGMRVPQLVAKAHEWLLIERVITESGVVVEPREAFRVHGEVETSLKDVTGFFYDQAASIGGQKAVVKAAASGWRTSAKGKEKG